MSNMALYNKYRPKDFDDVVGQEGLVSILKNMIASDRVARQILLEGNRGLGKTTLAKIFAKALNCTGDGDVPCNECQSCRAINEGKSMDVIELDAASNRGIDTVRDRVINKVNFRPQGKYKVFILDEVHMFTTEAWNGMLKTLEEPPEYCVFIFCTTEPDKILKTILSRVQRFTLSDMTNDNIVGRLRYIADKENITITEDALYMIARYAKGGMRDSISALDQLSYMEKDIDAEYVSSILGVMNDDFSLVLLDSIKDGDVNNAVVELCKVVSEGSSPIDLFDNFMQVVRTLMKVVVGINVKVDVSSNDISSNTLEELMGYKDKYSVSDCIKLTKLLIDNESKIKYSADPQLSFMNFINEVSLDGGSASSTATVGTIIDKGLLARIEKLEKLVAEGNFSNDDISSIKSRICSVVNKEVEQLSHTKSVSGWLGGKLIETR